MTEKGQRSWFLRDDPIEDLSSGDHFGHGAYTEVLADAVLEASPPFTIGVFGNWGVGKTTIAKAYLESALKKKSGKRNIGYAYFDVWKYEGDSLRRQFLREVARQFKDRKFLTASYDPGQELQDLVFELTEPSEGELTFSWRRLFTAIVRAVFSFALAFIALDVLERAGVLQVGNDFLVSVLAGLIGAISGDIGKVIVVGQREVTKKSIDAPDLFEQKFKELMNAVTADKVVIVIDNLDRCTPDRVMEVLSTIKTFLEPVTTKVQPIFVVPCDHQAIRRHLTQRGDIEDSDADEYLRKFFNVTLRINPILEEEIREYVSDELKRLILSSGLSDDQRRELIQVITVAFRGNPRRVKQFLNTLTSKLMILRQREGKKLIDPPISGEIPFLAKLTIIEEEWPSFYQAIQLDVRTYEALTAHAIGISTDLGDRLSDFEEDDRLLGFLRGTRGTTSSNIRAFTRLKLAPAELRISNYWEYRNALLDGRLERVGAVLGDVDEKSMPSFQEVASQILAEEIGNGYYEAALNAVDAIIRTEALWERSLAERVVEQLYSVQQLRTLLPSLAPQETLSFLGKVDSEASRSLVTEFLNLLRADELAPYVPKEQMAKWQTEVARGLASVNEKLNSEHLKVIKDLTNGALVQNMQFAYEISRLQDGVQRFIGVEALNTAISKLAVESLKVKDDGSLQHSFASALWVRAKAAADENSVGAFVQRVTELSSQVPLDASAPGREPLLLLLHESRSVLPNAKEPQSDQLATQLINHYAYTVDHRRGLVIIVLSALFSGLSQGFRTQVQSLLTQFAESETVLHVGIFVASAASDGLDTYPDELLDLFLSHLEKRFSGATLPQDHQGIAGMLINHMGPRGLESLSAFVSKAIDKQNVQALTNTLDAHMDPLAESVPTLFKEALDRLVLALPKYPLDKQREALAGVQALSDHLDDETRLQVRDHVLKLADSDEQGTRNTGLLLVADAEASDILRDAERKYIVEQMVMWLQGRIERIDDSFKETLDRVTRDSSLIDDSSREGMINVLKGVLAKGPGFRALGAQYLASFPIPAERREEIVRELIHASKQEADPGLQAQIARQAMRVAGTDQRTKAFRTFREYLDELSNGTDEEKSLANELGADQQEA